MNRDVRLSQAAVLPGKAQRPATATVERSLEPHHRRRAERKNEMIDQVETNTDVLELALTELDEVVGGLVNTGTGTLIISSANTYTGVTRINEGIIAI